MKRKPKFVQVIESGDRHYEVSVYRGRRLAPDRWKWTIACVVADGRMLSLSEAKNLVRRVSASLRAQGVKVTSIELMG
jgi:hypothetical protein